MEELFASAVRDLEAGRLAEAEEKFYRHLVAHPQDAMAHNKLGVIRAQQHDYAAAKELFAKALALDSRCVHALNNLGNIAREEGDLEAAKSCYLKAIAIDPDYSVPHNNLAVVYKQQNKYADFVRELKLARRLELRAKLNPERKTLRQALADLWRRR